ncbi:hypothetical protein Q0O39_14250, partial [Staphylococcus aureus]|nr:hypothetical protein [Staphylococcus aureus]
GGLAYDATKNLVLLNFITAINTMLEVSLIAGAIELGLLFSDQISKLIVSGFVKSFILLYILLELAQHKLLSIIYKVQL